MKKHINLVKKYLPWLVLSFAFFTVMAFNYLNSLSGIDSDMAAELIYSNMMLEERNIIVNDWFWSTGIKFFDPTLIYAIFLLIFPTNWSIARVCSIFVILLLVIASYIYMAKVISPLKTCIYFSSLVILPYHYWMLQNVSFGCYYTFYFISTMICVGTFLRMISYKSTKQYVLHAIILSTFSLMAGIQGQRLVLTLFIPLGIMCVIEIAYQFHTTESYKINIKRDILPYAFAIINAGIGFIINNNYLSVKYNIKQYDISWQPFDISKIINMLGVFFSIFGYIVDDFFEIPVNVLSPIGILACFGLLFCFFMFFAFTKSIISIKSLQREDRLITMLTFLSVFFTIVAITLMGVSGNGSHLLTSVPLAILLFQRTFERLKFRHKYGRTIVGVVIGICVLCASFATMQQFEAVPRRAPQDIKPVSRWLKENGYQKGISDFWHSNVITELTDGGIEMWTISIDHDELTLNTACWLQRRSHEYFEDDTYFILLPNEQLNVIKYLTDTGKASYVYEDPKYSVIEVEIENSEFAKLSK